MNIQYKKKEYLQDAYEHKLFKILKQIASDSSGDLEVMPQVHLGRIIDMTCSPLTSKCKYFLHHGMNQLSFDFVLFNKSLQPLLAIELDGISHTQFKRKTRDSFVQEICREAELPLLRIPISDNYDVEKLSKEIKGKIK